MHDFIWRRDRKGQKDMSFPLGLVAVAYFIWKREERRPLKLLKWEWDRMIYYA